MVGCSKEDSKHYSDEAIIDDQNSRIEMNQFPENQIQSEEQEWIPVGLAFFGENQSEIEVGVNYNVINTQDFGHLNIINYSYGGLVEEISDNSFLVYPNIQNQDDIIELRNVEIEGDVISFLYRTNTEIHSMDLFKPGTIEITNPENVTNSWPSVLKWITENIIVPVVVDRVTEELTDEGGSSSCAEQAVETCGDAGVKSVDTGGWFDGCSFTCK